MSKRKALKGLYLISRETQQSEAEWLNDIEAGLKGGASILQYRDKSSDDAKRLRQAQALRQLCADYACLFIINDDVALAKTVSADGVHLGKDDAALRHARDTLSTNTMIGISCYNQLPLALAAQDQGADYVAFGTAFPSQTKPDAVQASLALYQQAKQTLTIPVCAIGGITLNNINELVATGIDMAAVINGVFAAENIEQTAKHFCQHLGS